MAGIIPAGIFIVPSAATNGYVVLPVVRSMSHMILIFKLHRRHKTPQSTRGLQEVF